MNAKAKLALTTGFTGRDGSYLAEFLLGKGYAVRCIKRRASMSNIDRVVGQEVCREMAWHYPGQTKQNALLKQHGYAVTARRE